MRIRFCCGCINVVGLLLLVGCGGGDVGKTTAIEGIVKIDGKPMESGQISMQHSNGKGAIYSVPIQTGRYVIVIPANAIKGEMTVRITGGYRTGRRVPGVGPNMLIDEILPLPQKYNVRSELKF